MFEYFAQIRLACSLIAVHLSNLRPAVLLAQQICVEVRHLPHPFVGKAPHQFPVAHVMKLLPSLLCWAAFFKFLDGLAREGKVNRKSVKGLEELTFLLARRKRGSYNTRGKFLLEFNFLKKSFSKISNHKAIPSDCLCAITLNLRVEITRWKFLFDE